MTIAHRSEGPRADCAVCPDGDHVSAIICLGRTWVQRSCRSAGVAPRVVTVEEDAAARRIYPARVTQQPGMEVTTGLQGALRRWSILGKRADTVAMGWTARKTRTWQTLTTRGSQMR